MPAWLKSRNSRRSIEGRGALVILSLFLFSGTMLSGPLEECERVGNLITFPVPLELSKKVISFEIPTLRNLPEVRSEEPVVFMLTADAEGVVIDLRLVRGTMNTQLEIVARFVREWKFKPTVYQGRPICSRGPVYVYLRSNKGVPELVIPAFSDRDQIFSRAGALGLRSTQ